MERETTNTFRNFINRLLAGLWAMLGAPWVVAAPVASDADLAEFLARAALGPVMAKPETHHVQVLYAPLERGSDGAVSIKKYRYRVDKNEYFYPASTVKLPVAALALERLGTLPGATRDSVLLTGAGAPEQRPVAYDAFGDGALPTVGRYIEKIAFVSDNDAYNRLYEWLGPQHIESRLRALGLEGVRIRHRLSVSLSEEAGYRLNPGRLLAPTGQQWSWPLRRQRPELPGPVLPLGRGEWLDGQVVPGPKAFDEKNAYPLEAQLNFLQSLYFPESVPAEARLALPEAARRWFLQRFGMLAPRSGYAAYDALPEGFVKFLAFGGSAPALPEDLVIFNKVGDAYGFLTDVAYFVERSTQTEFLLAATVYVNENGIFNDDHYEYETVGFPFLRALGQALLEEARERPRTPLPAPVFDALIPWPPGA
jgi:hypothetical protein